MSKKLLSESDICAKYITPHLASAGWDEATQIRREVSFTKGRIIVRGKLVARGQAQRADYVLYYRPNRPIALIEAKDNTHQVGDGMQQALDYAITLDIPFVFSSNGDGFVFHDRTGTSAELETTLPLDAFPAPAELWTRYRAWKGLTPEVERIVLQDYYDDGNGKTPRYYQCSAINAAVEAIAKGQQRLLLVMATGTGKTHRFPNHLAVVESWRQETHPVSRGPQYSGGSDPGQRLSAVRPGHGQTQHQRQNHRPRCGFQRRAFYRHRI